MSMAVGPNRGVKNEINVTPLVDVRQGRHPAEGADDHQESPR